MNLLVNVIVVVEMERGSICGVGLGYKFSQAGCVGPTNIWYSIVVNIQRKEDPSRVHVIMNWFFIINE